MRIHRRLADSVLNRTRAGTAVERVGAWEQALGAQLEHWQRTLTEMRSAGGADFATLTVGVETLRKLTD
jgi:NAD-specific glutamate dehydrogenase